MSSALFFPEVDAEEVFIGVSLVDLMVFLISFWVRVFSTLLLGGSFVKFSLVGILVVSLVGYRFFFFPLVFDGAPLTTLLDVAGRGLAVAFVVPIFPRTPLVFVTFSVLEVSEEYGDFLGGKFGSNLSWINANSSLETRVANFFSILSTFSSAIFSLNINGAPSWRRHWAIMAIFRASSSPEWAFPWNSYPISLIIVFRIVSLVERAQYFKSPVR